MPWPYEGDLVYIITGTGRIVATRWAYVKKLEDRKAFLGVYATLKEAQDVYSVIKELCQKPERY